MFLSNYLCYIPGAPYGTKFIMLSPCTSSTDCARCQMTNYSVTMMVNYFMVAIFVVRPWMIVYSVSNNSPLLDLIPNLMNTVLYTYISLEYITNFYWVKHSNVKRWMCFTFLDNFVFITLFQAIIIRQYMTIYDKLMMSRDGQFYIHFYNILRSIYTL